MIKNDQATDYDGEKGIILFDGYCNLCSWSVHFIIKRDAQDHFRFASLQSETGNYFLKKFKISGDFDQSVVLVEGNAIYFESDAALQTAKRLRHLWPLLYILILLPKPTRDTIYRFIAKNRFKWFGKKDSCYMPREDLSYKFL